MHLWFSTELRQVNKFFSPFPGLDFYDYAFLLEFQIVSMTLCAIVPDLVVP
jgi:hypothetical protein